MTDEDPFFSSCHECENLLVGEIVCEGFVIERKRHLFREPVEENAVDRVMLTVG